MKRATASYCERISRSGRRLERGSLSGGTANSCSACRRKATRLVTSILSLGQAVNTSASTVAASITCSKLSTKRSSCFSLSDVLSRSRGVCPLLSLMESVWSMASTTCSESVIVARGTKNSPLGKCSESSAATCMARRVLPTPASPVSVTSRTSGRSSNRVISATSFSRPIKGVGCMGRLLGEISSVLREGNSAGKPSTLS
jgi:hypothetical protein